MTATRPYGTWCSLVNSHASSPDSEVDDVLGTGTPEWRQRVIDTGALDQMRAEYRQAINDALPGDVSLCGNEFIGPAEPEPGEFDDYPRDEDGRLDFAALLDDIDVDAIVDRHDPDA
ncbi:hypothetical protein ACIP9H_33450 [Streptomyces sp. NPDC088732]|uniref:hypothetical protein n=1 Tax=Streptomyces sp. NPDC088732 TaxID=3365879 RepID=UPI003815386D